MQSGQPPAPKAAETTGKQVPFDIDRLDATSAFASSGQIVAYALGQLRGPRDTAKATGYK